MPRMVKTKAASKKTARPKNRAAKAAKPVTSTKPLKAKKSVKTVAKKPVAKKITVKKAAPKKPAFKRPAAKKVVSKKPAAKKPAPTKTASQKPAAKQVAKTAAPEKASTLAIGSAVPTFAMPATVIGEAATAKLHGKPFVIYFYPKDDTSGCTAQACGFRDAAPAFDELGLTVIGVSKDNIQSHEKFAKKYDLTFPLASDQDGKVCAAFGTWVEKSMYGRKYMGIERSTFLVDSNGIVRAEWRKVNVPGHIDEVTKAIANL